MTELHGQPILSETIRTELTRAINPEFSSGIGYRTGTQESDVADAVEYEIGSGTGIYVGVGPNKDDDTGHIYVYIADMWAHKEAYDAPEELHDILRHESSFCHSLALELEELIRDVYDADVISFSRARSDDNDSVSDQHGQYYVQGLPPEATTLVSTDEE